MKVRMMTLLILFLAFFCAQSFAQYSPATEKEAANPWVIYHVIDKVTVADSTMEMWRAQNVMEIVPSDYGVHSTRLVFQVVRERFGEKPRKEVETFRHWSRDVFSANSGTYLTYRFVIPLSWLEEDDKGFGHVEENNASDGSFVRNWPMFYTKEYVDELWQLTFRMFMPDGSVTTVVKKYKGNKDVFPLYESHVTVDRSNVITKSVIYTKFDD